MREIKFRAFDTKVKQPMWDHEGTLSLLMLQGRVLDGTADDVQINAAIAALPAGGGGTLRQAIARFCQNSKSVQGFALTQALFWCQGSGEM